MNLEIITEKPGSVTHATPILFVHGMWHSASCWLENFMPYFAKHGYETHALSLRGHGGSDGHKRLRWTSIKEYVSDLEQVASQFKTPPVLVGHSMGGMIIQKYLEKHQVPAGILLASSSPKGVLPGTLRFIRRHPLLFLKVNIMMSMAPIVATPALAREVFFSADMPENKLQDYFEKLEGESFRAYMDLLGLNLPNPKQVKTPLLVLGAEDDKMISTKEVIATGKAYGTEAELFPNMAHGMMLEEGWQSVADRILGWLEKQQLDV